MKKISLFVVGAMIASATTSCYRIDASDVGIMVDQFGTDKGKPIVIPVSGTGFYNPFTRDIHEWNAYVLHKSWTADVTEDSPKDEHIPVTSSEGGVYKCDVTLNFSIQRDKAADVFRKWRLDLPELIDTRIRALVRKAMLDVAVGFATDSLLQHRNIYEAQVNKVLLVSLDTNGFNLDNLVIVKMVPTGDYQKAIDEKIRITQETAKAKAGILKAEAEAKIKIVNAQAEAEAIKIVAASLTAEYVELKRVEAWKAGGSKTPQMTGNNISTIIPYPTGNK